MTDRMRRGSQSSEIPPRPLRRPASGGMVQKSKDTTLSNPVTEGRTQAIASSLNGEPTKGVFQ